MAAKPCSNMQACTRSLQEYIRGRRREYLTAEKLFLYNIIVQRSPHMLLCGSYDNTLSICSTNHIIISCRPVYPVLRKELLQAGILELDTLLSTLGP